MKRIWIPLLILVLAAGAGAAWWAQRRGASWSSDSPEAIAELEAARQAGMKFYYQEASTHLERALELDPQFVVAKIFLVRYGRNHPRRETFIEELRQVDRRGLRGRERFLLEQLLLRHDGETAAANEALDSYLAEHPSDPFALSIAADQAWEAQDFERARSLNLRLLEVDPNWVQAQNYLGYLAMAQGLFDEAEKQFETYAYVAPDQPNPHDSMAELLTLTGRYDEAREELEEALALRPEFCASYLHLITVETLSSQMDRAAEVLDRAREHCDEAVVDAGSCQLAFWQAAIDSPPQDVWARLPEGCRDVTRGEGSGTVSRAALAAGERRVFDEHLEQLRATLQKAGSGDPKLATERGLLSHHEGIEALATGRIEGAARRLEAADRQLAFWGDGVGILKLANRADLARAQELLGDAAAADRTRQSIAEVNPQFLELGSRVPLYRDWP